MLIYIILFLIILHNVYKFDIQKKGTERQRIWHFHFCALILIVVSSLSYRVGIDSTRYEEGFLHYPILSEFKFKDLQYFNNEPFWVLLNIIVKSFFNSWVIVKLVVMISFTMSLFYVIRRTTRYVFSVVLLFYVISWLPFCFESLRQTMALSFFLWGAIPLYEGDFKKYLIRAWPMVLFHSSGIVIFLLAICFKFIKSTKIICIVILSLFGLSALFSDYMYSIANIINFVSAETAEEMQQSFTNETYGLKSQSLIGLLVHGIQYVFPSVLLSYYYRLRNNNMISSLLLLFSIFSIFSFSWIICYRFCDYFRVFYYIAICDFLLVKTEQHKGLIMKGVIVAGTVVLLYFKSNTLFNSSLSNRTSLDVRYFPYHSVLTKEKDPYREQYVSELTQFTTLFK